MKTLLNAIFAAFLLLIMSTAQAERIKDLASIGGVRDNQLVGYSPWRIT